VTIAVCATICGADNWVTIANFGQAKESWFRTFLPLEHGIPSHDTFRRVFALPDKGRFQAGYMEWIAAIVALLPGPIIAIDGKTAREAHDGRTYRTTISSGRDFEGIRHTCVLTNDCTFSRIKCGTIASS
jgi:hypothetical protein